jgi:hypothetical protein
MTTMQAMIPVQSQQQVPWINPKLEPRLSSCSKIGMFSQTAIAKHELLAVFGGIIMSKHEVSQ